MYDDATARMLLRPANQSSIAERGRLRRRRHSLLQPRSQIYATKNSVSVEDMASGLEREGQTWELIIWTTGGKL
jgi:hypothetical protein